jgi:hypothetical protein
MAILNQRVNQNQKERKAAVITMRTGKDIN